MNARNALDVYTLAAAAEAPARIEQVDYVCRERENDRLPSLTLALREGSTLLLLLLLPVLNCIVPFFFFGFHSLWLLSFFFLTEIFR